MKKHLLTLVLSLMLIFIARAQTLQNTYWRDYDTLDIAGAWWHFEQDTLSYSFNNINYIDLSIYTTIGNVCTMVDLPLAGCIVSDTGRYNFSIQSDTLRFTLISDPCFYRSSFFTTHYFVRLLTGTAKLNSLSQANIYPNPSEDGIYNISLLQFEGSHVQIDVLSSDGRKLKGETFSKGALSYSVNIQVLSSGVYFLIMQDGDKKKVIKLMKQ